MSKINRIFIAIKQSSLYIIGLIRRPSIRVQAPETRAEAKEQSHYIGGLALVKKRYIDDNSTSRTL
jgi:hypothetical protein